MCMTRRGQGQFKIDLFCLHSQLLSIVYVSVNKKMQRICDGRKHRQGLCSNFLTGTSLGFFKPRSLSFLLESLFEDLRGQCCKVRNTPSESPLFYYFFFLILHTVEFLCEKLFDFASDFFLGGLAYSAPSFFGTKEYVSKINCLLLIFLKWCWISLSCTVLYAYSFSPVSLTQPLWAVWSVLVQRHLQYFIHLWSVKLKHESLVCFLISRNTITLWLSPASFSVTFSSQVLSSPAG